MGVPVTLSIVSESHAHLATVVCVWIDNPELQLALAPATCQSCHPLMQCYCSRVTVHTTGTFPCPDHDDWVLFVSACVLLGSALAVQ